MRLASRPPPPPPGGEACDHRRRDDGGLPRWARRGRGCQQQHAGHPEQQRDAEGLARREGDGRGDAERDPRAVSSAPPSPAPAPGEERPEHTGEEGAPLHDLLEAGPSGASGGPSLIATATNTATAPAAHTRKASSNHWRGRWPPRGAASGRGACDQRWRGRTSSSRTRCASRSIATASVWSGSSSHLKGPCPYASVSSISAAGRTAAASSAEEAREAKSSCRNMARTIRQAAP